MSTSTIEPGTRFASRYRLEERVSEAFGSTLWRAVDETLARSVSVRTFDDSFPRTREVVTAARAASRSTDSRLTQVFDADDAAGNAYVVSEWITGERLTDLLASGPLDPNHAGVLVAETAEAVAAAHDAGLAHLRLQPQCLIWTRDGTLKVLGFGVDAALYDLSAEDSAAADAQGLGRLLYAALTGYWPGTDDVGLPPAPHSGGQLCSPRQVRAGIPLVLDAITERALLQESRRNDGPLASPAQVVQALSGIPRPPAFPPPPSTPPATPTVTQQPTGGQHGTPTAGASGAQRASGPPQQPPPQRRPASYPSAGGGPSVAGKVVVGAVVLLVMAVIGIGGIQLGRMLGPQPGDQSPPDGSSTKSGDPRAARVLHPASASDFDPRGGDGENPEDAPLAIDGKQATAWTTQSYASAEFGQLKSGVGLVLDMGKRVNVSRVTARLGGQPGGSIELRVSNTKQLASFHPVDSAKTASAKVTLHAKGKERARYLLLWFTKLPPKKSDDRFKGHIAEVVVRGTK